MNCRDCRFWSEMMAEVVGGVLRAACLHTAKPSLEMTTENDGCELWKSGHHGAVDAPPNLGEQSRAAYEREENHREQ